MSVSNDSYYKPEEALKELMLQECILCTAIDIQALLGLLVVKGIITKEEIDMFRGRVRNLPKYKNSIEEIERLKMGFSVAKDNPEEYLKTIFNAKMNGKIK